MAREIEALNGMQKYLPAASRRLGHNLLHFNFQAPGRLPAWHALDPSGQLMLDTSQRNEESVNEDAITTIAQEMHYPLPVVKRVYEAEFARLKASARITDYLVLFAARRTRDALLARQP